MKKLYLIAVLAFAAFSTSAQNFFFEDFDGCDLPTGWANINTVGDTAWVFGDNAAGTPAGSVDGTCMAYVHDDDLTGAAAPLIADLISPIVDISSLDTAVLKFDYIYRHLGTQSFEVALWNGADWDTVLTINTSNPCNLFFPACAPEQAEIDLSGYLVSDFRMKFIFDDGAAWNWYVGLDNIAIYVPPADDAAGIEEVTLMSGCGLTATETVSFVVENIGGNTISSIMAGYQVGAQSASETFTVSIAPGDQDTLVFNTPVDMSAVGTYDFAIWTELGNDQDPTNDTIFVTQENIPVISTLPYSEGFESGTGFWSADGSWELGAPAGTLINAANNGVNAWVTNLAGDYPNGENAFVVSPCFDFSALTVDPVFRFAHIFDTENCCDEGFVDITFDEGATWTRLGLSGQGVNWYDDAANSEWDGDGVNGAGTAWRNAEHVLDGAAGQSSVRIRIGFSSDGSVANEGFGFDDIEIFEFPTVNAGVVEILTPQNGCGLSSETVTIVVENTGLENVVDYTVGFDAGVGAFTQLVGDTLFVGGVDTITFGTPADLSALGDYNIAAWTEIVGDGDPGNDSAFAVVSNIPVVSTLPYTEDFESGANGWVAGGNLSTWELGDPETAFIDTANSGVNAWVTNLTGIYNNNEESFVESPCFDFSSLTVDPVFRFAFIANSEVNWDGTVIQTSIDAGSTWTTVGNVGEGTNWYTNAIDNWWDEPFGAADEWTVATHLLDGVAGEGSVKIRVFFDADGSFNAFDGFAFDDIEIFEQPSINAGVIEVISPISGCGLGTEDVTIVIQNFGDADLVDFNVGYDAGLGSGSVVELIGDTLFAASVDTFTFSTPAVYTANGTYDFAAWTAVDGDGDVLNDSLFTSVTSSPIVSSLPYFTDFEAGADGWYSTGENGVWELGDPEGILIDTANSGVNAWATNLDSTLYGADQLSYLISPCLDFSGLVIDPILEFALIGNSETGWDGMWLEASTDAGQTWSVVGAVGEGTNWYTNPNFISGIGTGWDGNTADTVGWVIAENLITGVAGESDVVLRFVFDSDDIIFGEGFAIDDISITEQPPLNASVDAILTPTTECGLTAAEIIEFTVTNLGSIQMDSVVVSYSVNGLPEVMQVFTDTLSPNESGTYGFLQAVDMSAEGDYDITVWTSLDGDGDTSNDTLTVTVTNVPIISSFPYSIDFENGANGWTTTGAEGVWELGDPETAFIDTANSGVNAWVTVLDGNYPDLDNDTTYVESPCLDFSSFTDDPVLSFAGIFQTEACCDEGWVEVSTDGGATWTKLGTAGSGINWYNDAFDDFWNGISGAPNEWLNAEHLLDGTAGLSDVKVRFAFSSDFSVTNAGFGLDDISIREQAQLDLVAISVDSPMSGCELTDAEEVRITFWNKGLTAVGNFDVGFIVDGGTAQIETYPATVNTGDTVSFTFASEFADLSAPGAHTITAFTALAGDEDTSNDSIFDVEVINYSETPLSQTDVPTNAFISSTINEGTSSELFFCGLPSSLDGGCLLIESISIDSLTHTFVADLDIWLISPSGDTLELSTDNGGATDNMIGIVFTDTASTNIGTVTTDILPGFYAPEDADGFNALYTGNDPNGAWTLFIDDDAGGDDGQLFSWSMTFVDNSPTPVLNYSDTTICVYNDITLMVDQYDSYLWSTGNNSQEVQLFGNILGLGDTEISVTVDEGGCTGTSNSFVLTVDACAGISELAGLEIEVYPNPTAGDVVLDITGKSNGFLLEVLDVNGKVVYSETIGEIVSGLRKSIDLKNVATGLYFLKLDDGQSSTTTKLLKQ